MSQRHSVEMMESPPRGNNWDKFDGGTRFSKRKPAPQPGDSGYPTCKKIRDLVYEFRTQEIKINWKCLRTCLRNRNSIHVLAHDNCNLTLKKIKLIRK